jgi:hypothetical protein
MELPFQNAYAIVEFANEESVENALNHTGAHRVNGRNLKCKRREVKEFVSTIPKGTDRKKKVLDQLKQENLEINTLLAKCETVGNILSCFFFIKFELKN